MLPLRPSALLLAIIWTVWAGVLPISSADASEVRRTAFVLGGIEPVADWDPIRIALTSRLNALDVHPTFRQAGGKLVVEVDQFERGRIVPLLTRPGHVAFHKGGEAVANCPDALQPGVICLPAVTLAEPYALVSEIPEISGAIVAAAGVETFMAEPNVRITLTDATTKAFADLTSSMFAEKLSIVIDGEVWMSAVVREPILGGELVISGTDLDVEEIAFRLSGHSLPQALQIVEEHAAPPRQAPKSNRGRKR